MEGGVRAASGTAAENNAGAIVESDAGCLSRVYTKNEHCKKADNAACGPCAHGYKRAQLEVP